jgi:hypothetical protein
MKKINNKLLVIGLLALVTIFALSRVFRSPKLEGNLRKELVKIDTAKVTEVRIATATPGMLRLLKEGTNWFVQDGDKKYAADRDAVKGVIGTISALDAQRMVSRKQDKWETYNVGEKGINVSVYYGSNVESEFKVGKTGINQTRGNNQFNNGGGIEAYTYVRMSGEDEVYIVDGFLESSFNRELNDWRDHSFLRIPKDLVQKISFNYPDSGFVLEKKDSLWNVAGQQVAETVVTPFLQTLSYKNITTFSDSAPAGNAQLSMTINGSAGEIGKVEAWKTEQGWVLRSSQQPGVFFKGTEPNGVSDVFVGRSRFN